MFRSQFDTNLVPILWTNCFRDNWKRPSGIVLEKHKIRGANPWSSPFLGKFLSKQIIKRYKQGTSLLVFRMLLSFSCFLHELFVHVNENVSFQDVAF